MGLLGAADDKGAIRGDGGANGAAGGALQRGALQLEDLLAQRPKMGGKEADGGVVGGDQQLAVSMAATAICLILFQRGRRSVVGDTLNGNHPRGTSTLADVLLGNVLQAVGEVEEEPAVGRTEHQYGATISGEARRGDQISAVQRGPVIAFQGDVPREERPLLRQRPQADDPAEGGTDQVAVIRRGQEADGAEVVLVAEHQQAVHLGDVPQADGSVQGHRGEEVVGGPGEVHHLVAVALEDGKEEEGGVVGGEGQRAGRQAGHHLLRDGPCGAKAGKVAPRLRRAVEADVGVSAPGGQKLAAAAEGGRPNRPLGLVDLLRQVDVGEFERWAAPPIDASSDVVAAVVDTVVEVVVVGAAAAEVTCHRSIE